MALNLTDNWQIAKILTDNWHLYPPSKPSFLLPENFFSKYNAWLVQDDHGYFQNWC